jgi:hypothetical protein
LDVDWIASAAARIGDPDLLLETAGVVFAFNAVNRIAVDKWLSQGSLADSNSLLSWAAPSDVPSESGLVSECRRYSWQVANAAYTISDAQIRKIRAIGLSDAELLDLTLAAALFSALAIIEPLCATVAPIPIEGAQRLEPTPISSVL